MSAQRLLIRDFTRDGPFHVALIDAMRLRGVGTHDHDFYEMMYVDSGIVRHIIGEQTEFCRAGDLVLIRPQDVHSIRVKPGQSASITNVAFPAQLWQEYCRIARLKPDQPWPSSSDGPLTYSMPSGSMASCSEAFARMLQAYLSRPTILDLLLFWSTVLLCVGADVANQRDAPKGPKWLTESCRQFADPENLRGGVARLVELAGVSGAHLVRTMRSSIGITPTEYVNELRLQRSAAMLISSHADIAEIALDCGYENLSYFYRLFKTRFGLTPRQYRLKNTRTIAP